MLVFFYFVKNKEQKKVKYRHVRPTNYSKSVVDTK